jgi:hypothetical protein
VRAIETSSPLYAASSVYARFSGNALTVVAKRRRAPARKRLWREVNELYHDEYTPMTDREFPSWCRRR